MTITKFFKVSLLLLTCASSSYASDITLDERDPAGRAIYETMGNWDLENDCPKQYDFDGTGVIIAVLEGSHCGVTHPALRGSDITLIGSDLNEGLLGKSHAIEMTSLISGSVESPQRPSYASCSSAYYYGGGAPGAKIYGYSVDVEDDTHSAEKLLEALLDIESKGDEIDLIHLSRSLILTPKIIEIMNHLAEQDTIFVQSAGNRHEGNIEPFLYREGAHSSDFSDLFYQRIIRVGALKCLPGEPLKMWARSEKIGSAYFSDPTGKKKFIFAPGSGIRTAGLDDTYIKVSGTSAAATFVTSLLALGLEFCDKEIDRGDLLDLLLGSRVDLENKNGVQINFSRLDYDSFFNNLTRYFGGAEEHHIDSSSLYQKDSSSTCYYYDCPIISRNLDHEKLTLTIFDDLAEINLRLNNFPILFGQNPEYSANAKEKLLKTVYRLFEILQIKYDDIDLSEGLNLENERPLTRTINRLSDGTLVNAS
ncbi:MAG: S8 family serine peptidase [bacterium]|nr:S8 family serine peptidase [bacterium]